MYRCKNCGQVFEETDSLYIEDDHGEIKDYVDICPLCGSVDVEEEK